MHHSIVNVDDDNVNVFGCVQSRLGVRAVLLSINHDDDDDDVKVLTMPVMTMMTMTMMMMMCLV